MKRGDTTVCSLAREGEHSRTRRGQDCSCDIDFALLYSCFHLLVHVHLYRHLIHCIHLLAYVYDIYYVAFIHWIVH